MGSLTFVPFRHLYRVEICVHPTFVSTRHLCLPPFLPTDTCAHRHLCPPTLHLCPPTLVPTDTCAHRHFCPPTLLPTDTFAHRHFCPPTLLPTDTFAHRHFCPPTLFAHRHFCPPTLVAHRHAHRHFCPPTLLPTDTCSRNICAHCIIFFCGQLIILPFVYPLTVVFALCKKTVFIFKNRSI